MSTSLLWNCVIHYECSCWFETSPKYCIKKWFLITNVAGSYSYFSLHWHDNIISLQIQVSLSEAAGMATGVQIRECGDVLGRESCPSLLHGTWCNSIFPFTGMCLGWEVSLLCPAVEAQWNQTISWNYCSQRKLICLSFFWEKLSYRTPSTLAWLAVISPA